MIAGCETGYTLKLIEKHLLYLLENQNIFLFLFCRRNAEKEKQSRSIIVVVIQLTNGTNLINLSIMEATNIKFVYQNEVNDIFSYENNEGEIEYTKFPRSMGMSVEDVENYLN